MKSAPLKEVTVILRKLYPNVQTALHFRTPHEMLVATILSAQCTDERVNKVTPALFERYKSPADFAEADQGELEKLIHSTGFFRNKARNIIASARMIVKDFGGEVPRTMEEMLQLPGVARKTANVVLQSAYDIVEGVVVDTHIGRVSRRLGWSKEKNAVKVEQDLMRLIDKRDWQNVGFWLIEHGRALCKSQKPLCGDCPLAKMCPSAGSFDAKGKWVGVK